MRPPRLGILKFEPYFRPVRWGGSRLASFKGAEIPYVNRIGESWEISVLPEGETPVAEGEFRGRTLTDLLATAGEALMGKRLYDRFGNFFPLMVKFIDADDDLSIQVHPDDSSAPDGRGKTELWYIIKSDPGAYIYSGFNRPLNREKLCAAMEANRLVNVLAKHFPSPGDVFYLPAGRIHSIGAGNLLLEIQQTSGTTYRLHDYNRLDTDGHPRQLHVNDALGIIDYSQTDFGLARPQMLIGVETLVKTTPFFSVSAVQVMNSVRLGVAELDSPRIIVSIAGSGTVVDDAGNEARIRRGETILVPAEAQWVEVTATSAPLKLISVFIDS